MGGSSFTLYLNGSSMIALLRRFTAGTDIATVQESIADSPACAVRWLAVTPLAFGEEQKIRKV